MSSVRVENNFEIIKDTFINNLFGREGTSNKYDTFLKNYEVALNNIESNKSDLLELTNNNIIDKVLLTDIIITKPNKYTVVVEKINEFRKKYTIIKYIYNTDFLYKDIENDDRFEKLKENKSIAFIANDNASSYRLDYVYFLKSEDSKRTNGDDNQFLLIWNHYIYSILNLNYVKQKYYLKYTHIYILYRIFCYFLNICIDLNKNLKKVNYSDLYDNETVKKIIEFIILWDKNYNNNNNT